MTEQERERLEVSRATLEAQMDGSSYETWMASWELVKAAYLEGDVYPAVMAARILARTPPKSAFLSTIDGYPAETLYAMKETINRMAHARNPHLKGEVDELPEQERMAFRAKEALKARGDEDQPRNWKLPWKE